MDSWSKFLKSVQTRIETLKSQGCDILFFRGHSKIEYKLLPSLWWHPYPDQIESVLYYDFISNSAPLNISQNGPWDILFEMRHCGLPTRLLDWTENFAVALYFAIRDNPSSPCIYILDPFELNKKTYGEECIVNPNTDLKYTYFGAYVCNEQVSNELPVAICPIKQSKRIFAQKGAFTIHGKNMTPLEELFPECITRIDIPISAIPAAYDFLELAGVNEYTLFPDLDGLAKYLDSKLLKSYR